MAIVELDGKDGYINEQGEIIIAPRFYAAWPFAPNGLAMIKDHGAYGFINEQGEIVIEKKFLYASSFSANGLAQIGRISGDDYYINEKGEVIHDIAAFLKK